MKRSEIQQAIQPVSKLPWDILHLFVLSSFAVAQPLFDLLSQYAGFFVAHKSAPEDIFGFTLLVLLAIPLFLSLVEWIMVSINQKLGIIVHIFFVGILVGIIALPILGKIPYINSTYQMLGTVAIGLLFCWAYWSSALIGTFLNFVSPALLVFPVLFLSGSEIQAIAFPQNNEHPEITEVDNPIPVVVVVFDEFNVTSIMNEHREIDQELFPKLAQFASKAYWFRNATGVSDGTHYAVPAISSGLYASKRQPTSHDYPQSLFSILGGTHTFNVFESVTHLCAPEHCPEAYGQKRYLVRLSNLLSDIYVVYLHILVPEAYSESLPVINQGWSDFLQTGAISEKSPAKAFKGGWMGHVGNKLKLDRVSIFRNFINNIPNLITGPSLNYLHILLPHAPYQYLPSGKNYGAHPLTGLQHENREKWGDDEWAIWQSWQRSQLQLVFTDSLLGELFQSLKEKGMFEESLIIITADHGVSFKENEYRRVGTKSNYMDILSVPLFIKVPYQKQGVISDANVETIDILPTVTDLMGIDLDAEVDGLSVFDSERLAKRVEKRLYIDSAARDIIVSGELPERYQTLEKRLALFGTDGLIDKLFSMGPDKHLVGKRIAPLIREDESFGSSVQLDRNYEAENIEKNSGPNYIRGTLFRERSNKEQVRLALSVNGTIRAVTKTLKSLQDDWHEFVFLVPEEAYADEINQIEILAIGTNASGLLTLSRFKPSGTYQLLHTSDGVPFQIRDSSGVRIPIRPDTLRGYIDRFSLRDGVLEISGWAADTENQTLPKLVVVFVNDKFVHAGGLLIPRKDVVKVLNEPAYLLSGYSLAVTIPDKYLDDNFGLEVYAISEYGVASQLILTARVVSRIESVRSNQ